MTIKVKTGFFASARDHGVVYAESAAVGLVSIVGERHESQTSLTEVTAACVRRLAELVARWSATLQNHRFVLFTATPPQPTPNVVARRYGIWGWEEIRWLNAEARRSECVEFHDATGTRFVGLAEVPAAQLVAAADYVRTVGSAILFLSSRLELTDEQALALCARAFPSRQSSVHWPSIVQLLPGTNDILLKVHGGFDDREAAVYAFMGSDLLKHLTME